MKKDIERIPFEIVISDKKLLGGLWKELSMPQQVALKCLYGLPLKSPAEQAVWAIFNDQCTYDELGYPTSVTPIKYEPKEYGKLVGLLGRRSGKSTHITAFAVLYEILFGGHQRFAKPSQSLVIPYVATDLATAIENMMAIREMVKSQSHLIQYLEGGHEQNLRDEIRFTNGFTITAMSTSIKLGRGWAIPVVVMDEVGFWYTKTDAAHPDFEVRRAVSGSMLQFEPFSKMFIISTPYVEDGILWEAWQAGTDGKKTKDSELKEKYQDVLVIWATTAAMANPQITLDAKGKPTRIKLERKKREDGEAFPREYLARFIKSVGGLIEPTLLDKAIQSGIKERIKDEVEKSGLRPQYVATMDPATRGDEWAFTIGHRDNEGKVIQDVLRVWSPPKGGYLNPSEILDEIASLCKSWNVNMITTDQHQFESLEQLAIQKGLALFRLPFSQQSKVGIYGSLLHLLKDNNIELLDLQVIREQLFKIQRKFTALNNVQIGAPPGSKDDVATVIALLAKMALTMTPSMKVEKKTPSLLDQVIANKVKRERELAMDGAWG